MHLAFTLGCHVSYELQEGLYQEVYLYADIHKLLCEKQHSQVGSEGQVPRGESKGGRENRITRTAPSSCLCTSSMI